MGYERMQEFFGFPSISIHNKGYAMSSGKPNVFSTFILIIITIALGLSLDATVARADTASGVSYLSGAQEPDGSWGGTLEQSITYQYHTTIEAVTALQSIAPNDSSLIGANAWIDAEAISSVDSLSRRVLLRKASHSQLDVATLFAAAADPRDSVIDNALMVRALKLAGKDNYVRVNNAFGSLVGSQNSDGGYGIQKNKPSHVYTTAMMIEALTDYLAAEHLTAAESYLLSRQHPDGGFGDTGSTVFETAIAYRALAPVTSQQAALDAAAAYLVNAQRADGSWNGDPFETALALQALYLAANPPANKFLSSITGRIIDGATNAPIQSATVTLDTGQTVTTGSDGTFDFVELPTKVYSVAIVAPNYLDVDLTVSLVPGVTSNMGDISLVKMISGDYGVVMGQVTDYATGLPIEGAELKIDGRMLYAITDANGNYIFPKVKPTTFWLGTRVYVEAIGYKSMNSWRGSRGGTKINAGQVSTWSPGMRVDTGGVIRGNITDAITGEAIEGAKATASGPVNAVYITRWDGAYYLTSLMTGVYEVTYTMDGYHPITVQLQTYGQSNFYYSAKYGVNTYFDPKMYPLSETPVDLNDMKISGSILDAVTDQTLSGVSITVNALGDVTAHSSLADGSFSITGIKTNSAIVRFEMAGYEPFETTLELTGQAVQLASLDYFLGQVRLRPVSTAVTLPDLTISNSDRSAAESDSTTMELSGYVYVTVANKGTSGVPAGSGLIAFSDTDLNGKFTEGVDSLLGEATLEAVAAGAEVSVTLSLAGETKFRDAPITLMVDAQQVITETNERNNSASSFISACQVPSGGSSATFSDPTLMWSPKYFYVEQSVTAQLNDDNNDGVIDQNDFPDIVGNEIGALHLKGFSGKDGSVIVEFEQTGSDYGTNGRKVPAVGDIDGDGLDEIIVFSRTTGGGRNKMVYHHGMIAYEHDGTYKWHTVRSDYGACVPGYSSITTTNFYEGPPSIVDINNDGVPEILSNSCVFDNQGNILWKASKDKGGIAGSSMTAADVNLDGTTEIVAGRTLYAADGTVIWHQDQIPADGHNVVANFDDDDFAEIVVATEDYIYLLEHTGEIIWGPVFTGPSSWGGGVPLVADIDGDGQVEIVISNHQNVFALDGDGSFLWRLPISDAGSGMNSASAFDFNRDGKYEILHNDEAFFRILDGETGSVIYRISNGALTGGEYPVIADLDNDGDAEIIVGASNKRSGLTGFMVLTSKDNDWPGARGVWNQFDYHITNVNDDGTIPVNEQPWWLANNNNHAQVSGGSAGGSSGGGSPDLSAGMLRASPGAGGQLSLTVRIGNAGSGAMSSGSTVAFYEGDPANGGTLLGTAPVGALGFGVWADVTLDNVVLTSGAPVYAVADPDNIMAECNEANNTVSASVVTPGDITVATDQSSYAVDTTVNISSVVTNIGDTSRDYEVIFKIEDTAGFLVTTLDAQSVSVAAGQSTSVTATWNTGVTIAGTYQVHAYLQNSVGGISDEAIAGFTILSDATLEGRLTVNQSTFKIYETAKFDGVIQNTGTNAAFTDLTASLVVTDGAGAVIASDAQAVSYLGPADLRSIGFSWPVGATAPGTYTATVTYTTVSGAVVGQWQVTFSIESSELTGEGLAGTLATTSEVFYQGAPGGFTYTVTNNGNATIEGIGLKIALVDAASDQVVTEFTTGSDLAITKSDMIDGAKSIDTGSIAVGDYVAILVATVNDNERGLATVAVTVKPPPAATSISAFDLGRVLVWINDGCQVGVANANKVCIDQSVVAATLDRLSKTYYMVYDKKSFQTHMRNSYFTSTLILGRHNPIESKYGEELRERVYGGKGLILTPFPGDDDAEELFGVKTLGALNPGDFTVMIDGTAPFTESQFPLTVVARKIQLDDADTAVKTVGLFESNSGVAEGPFPAVMTVERGNGPAVFFAFDLGSMSVGAEASLFDQLLEAALIITDRQTEADTYDPYQYTPVAITTTADIAVDVNLTLTFSDELTVYDNSSGEVLVSGFEKPLSLNPETPDEWKLIARAPDVAGAHEISVALSILIEGAWIDLGEKTFAITVEADTSTMAGNIQSAIAALATYDRAGSTAQRQALNWLAKAQASQDANDTAKAIDWLIKVTDELDVIATAEAVAVRADVGRLIIALGGSYYESQPANGN